MIQVKQLTSNSWMLSDKKTEKSVGIALRKDEKFVLLTKQLPFESLEDLVKHHFNSDIVEEDEAVDTNVEIVTQINGYPVKHKGACEFETKEIHGVKIETYKTRPNSKKVYAAGFYGLKFKNGLVGCICPVLKTLIDNGFIGPYVCEIDLQFESKKFNEQ